MDMRSGFDISQLEGKMEFRNIAFKVSSNVDQGVCVCEVSAYKVPTALCSDRQYPVSSDVNTAGKSDPYIFKGSPSTRECVSTSDG